MYSKSEIVARFKTYTKILAGLEAVEVMSYRTPFEATATLHQKMLFATKRIPAVHAIATIRISLWS